MLPKLRTALSLLLKLAWALLLAGGVWFGLQLTRPAAAGGGGAAPAAAEQRTVRVVCAEAARRLFERELRAEGSVAAKRFALVSARIPGPIDAIYVDEGEQVTATTTALFQTDALRLEKAVTIAEHDTEVAALSVEEARANFDSVKARLDKVRLDCARFRRLFHQDRAITRNALELQETALKQAEAGMRHASALLDLTRAREKQARSALAISEKDLDDSLVRAPISGVVSVRLREPGEMAGAGTPVLRIDDLGELEASAFVAAEHYAALAPGAAEATLTVGDLTVPGLAVTYRAPVIEPLTRTFEVRVEPGPARGALAPGALVGLSFVLERREGLGVPTEAVVVRDGRTVVFVAEGGRARKVVIEPGIRSGGYTEVLAGDLGAGALVIRRGQSFTDDGDPVEVAAAGAETR